MRLQTGQAIPCILVASKVPMLFACSFLFHRTCSCQLDLPPAMENSSDPRSLELVAQANVSAFESISSLCAPLASSLVSLA